MEEIITIFHFIQKKKKHELDLEKSIKCMTCTFFFFAWNALCRTEMSSAWVPHEIAYQSKSDTLPTTAVLLIIVCSYFRICHPKIFFSLLNSLKESSKKYFSGPWRKVSAALLSFILFKPYLEIPFWIMLKKESVRFADDTTWNNWI